ncbi:MAG: dihydrolipoyllysine-residue succinyltransferase [Oligoflexia bacterium]|nr:dihydrolipoyllysine-residue succinyltransferase [Oligoflexia bacterium]
MRVELVVPSVGESITEVLIASWYKKDGDFVNEDEDLVEVESDKATQTLPAPASGRLTIVAKEGTTLAIGQLIASIEERKVEKVAAHPSPATGKILPEKEISPEVVANSGSGSGKDGRITKEEDALKVTSSDSSDKPTKTTNARNDERSIERRRMSLLRKTVAKRLLEVKNSTAMLTSFNEVDMSETIALRKQFKERFQEKHGVSLGFVSLFTKATTRALQEIPEMNAQIDADTEEIIYHNYVDMAIAVSSSRGLVVPVVRGTNHLSLAEIEKEIARLATKAHEGKLNVDEMRGGTFTITNGGVFGSMLSTPLLNAPQVGILGMHNIVDRPVIINGQVVIRPIMYVALSYDHRLIDGKEAVTFLKRVKELIETPARLLLEV